MKAIVLATAATLLTVGLATVLFRVKKVHRGAFAFLCLFGLDLVIMAAIAVATPDDLTILPPGLLAKPGWFDLLAAVFFYSAAFFGGVLQIYNLVDRGFSLRIMVDLFESHNRCGSADALFDGYSQGKGMRWMYDKRIGDISRNGLVTINGSELVLTARGDRIAKFYAWLRQFLNVEGV